MFGREREMDLGQVSARSGRPDPVPGAAEPAPRPPYEPGRLALGLFTAAVLAAGAFMFVTLENDALDDPVKQAQRGEIGALDERSLVREANLRRVLRVVDAELQDGGYVDSFRLAPTRVDVILVQPTGRRENVQVDVAFDATSSDFGTGEGEGLQPADIDAAAPLRIVRAAREKLDLRPEHFDYLVANEPAEEGEAPTWTGFWRLPLMDNDVAAAGDGSDVRPLGTPDAKTRAEQERTP